MKSHVRSPKSAGKAREGMEEGRKKGKVRMCRTEKENRKKE